MTSLYAALRADDPVGAAVTDRGRIRLELGGMTVHMSIGQAEHTVAALHRLVGAPIPIRRFTDQHVIAVAAIGPGDWVLPDGDDDWQQVAAKVRGDGESDFTFMDGSQVTWQNKDTVTVGKPVTA